MEEKSRIIDVEPEENEKSEVFKRRLEVVTDIVVGSTMTQLQDVRTFQVAAGIGLYQGLKYRGNFKQGLKAGIATIGVVTFCGVVSNLINNYEDIKNA